MRARENSDYESHILRYCASVVTNTLPIEVVNLPCSHCNHPESRFQPLDIPPSAQSNQFKLCRDGRTPKEHLMAQCNKCGLKVSSQHLLRRALLQFRPPSWPVQLAELSAADLDKYIEKESKFFLSRDAKKYDAANVHDVMRKKFQNYLNQ